MYMDNLRGVYAASATPMHPDLSCDHEELARHYQDLVAKGCSGVVIFGTTGEGSSFTVLERKQTLEAVIPLGVDPRRCIVGIGCSAVGDAVELARCALKYRYASVMIVPPFFFKEVSDEGVIAYYREVIHRVDDPELRVILYHIPQFSGVPLTLTIIKALREEFPDTVIGLKESEGNLSLTREILNRFPGFKVFTGNEMQISEAVQLGAAGAISGVANIFPELICSLYRQDSSRQPEIQRILQILRDYPLFPAIKSLIEIKRGDRWHAIRPPLIPLETAQRLALGKAVFRTQP